VRAYRLLPVHLSMGWLLAFVGTPLIWLALAVAGAALAPPRRLRESEVPPLTAGKVALVAVPIALALAAYVGVFVLARGAGAAGGGGP